MTTTLKTLLALAAAGAALATAGWVQAQAPGAPKPPAGYATVAPLAAKNLLLAGARIGPRLVVVGEHGHVLVSDDHGAHWVQAKSVPTVTTLTAVHFLDPRHGWAVGHGGVVLLTTDAGDNWTQLAGKLDSQDILFSVWFKDAKNGLAVGAFGLALRTEDGGKTWNRFAVAEGEDGERHLNAIFPAPGGALWIAAEGGRLFRSDDAGRTWAKVTLPYKGSIWGGAALADGTLVAWGMRGNLLRSSDGGQNWQAMPTGTDQSLGSGVQLADGTLVVAGLGGVVLTSRDGAKSFNATVREDRAGLAAALPGAAGQVVVLGQAGVQTHPLAPAAASTPR